MLINWGGKILFLWLLKYDFRNITIRNRDKYDNQNYKMNEPISKRKKIWLKISSGIFLVASVLAIVANSFLIKNNIDETSSPVKKNPIQKAENNSIKEVKKENELTLKKVGIIFLDTENSINFEETRLSIRGLLALNLDKDLLLFYWMDNGGYNKYFKKIQNLHELNSQTEVIKILYDINSEFEKVKMYPDRCINGSLNTAFEVIEKLSKNNYQSFDIFIYSNFKMKGNCEYNLDFREFIPNCNFYILLTEKNEYEKSTWGSYFKEIGVNDLQISKGLPPIID